MRRAVFIILLAAGVMMSMSSTISAEPKISDSVVPLPPTVAGLPSIVAEPWLEIDPNPEVFIEGPAFDREGNLFITSIFDSRVLKITPDKKVSTIFKQDGLLPDGLAIHKDGRIFMACISGKWLSINPDGSNPVHIEPRHEGRPAVGNDLVFDKDGNLYVTDWTGNIADASGGVYRFSADMKSVKPVIQGLVTPNGVALSPSGRTLWVPETNRNQLVALNLMEDGLGLDPIEGVKVPWRFSGGSAGGPDSNCMDVAGNLYQCVIFQGRVLILNQMGLPLANVLIPDRDEGKHLRTTNVAFKPGTDEVYLTASGEGGAWIFKFKGLDKGLKLYSHQ